MDGNEDIFEVLEILVPSIFESLPEIWYYFDGIVMVIEIDVQCWNILEYHDQVSKTVVFYWYIDHRVITDPIISLEYLMVDITNIILNIWQAPAKKHTRPNLRRKQWKKLIDCYHTLRQLFPQGMMFAYRFLTPHKIIIQPETVQKECIHGILAFRSDLPVLVGDLLLGVLYNGMLGVCLQEVEVVYLPELVLGTVGGHELQVFLGDLLGGQVIGKGDLEKLGDLAGAGDGVVGGLVGLDNGHEGEYITGGSQHCGCEELINNNNYDN